ncbi:MAG: metallophosphoesterase [Sandaracinaceae bacterium]|nr:metallophosphoesterase [Sandaracinaceae bacterium]
MSTRDQDTVARVREALAEDERTHALDIEVTVTREGIVLSGDVETPERRVELELVARGAAPPDARIVNRIRVFRYRVSPRSAPAGALRVAAVGDLHVGRDSRGAWRARLSSVAAHADVLLLAGDLTQHGRIEEGRILAEELTALGVPIVCVLGNHDYHCDRQHEIARGLEAVGAAVLEGTSLVLSLRGRTLGVAGVKGFGSGFAGACASEFGEPEMKAYVHHAKEHARVLEEALRALDTDVRVALTHYSPIQDTLEGERREIHPFLGSYLLGEAIDAAGCDLAVHGHAHRGVEIGVTPSGVPVRNVAAHVIREAYRVYRVEPGLPVSVQPALR